MDIDEVKEFLRVDYDDEDQLIKSLISASDKYLENAGANKSAGEDLYDLGQKLLVSHWYDNRQSVASGEVSHAVEFALKSIIFQLKWCSEGDADGSG